jgi:hypothetical protein
MLRRVALVKTDGSEKSMAFIFAEYFGFLVTDNVVSSAPILVTLMMEVILSSETSILTSRKTASHPITRKYTTYTKQTPWPLVRERNLPTERPIPHINIKICINF